MPGLHPRQQSHMEGVGAWGMDCRTDGHALSAQLRGQKEIL